MNQPSENEDFTLSGRPLAGLNATSFEIEGLDPTVSVSNFDALGKVVTVNTASAAKDHPFQVRYPVQPRLRKGVLADVEIRLNTSARATDEPVDFQITFTPKQARWIYYVVAGVNPAAGEIQIVNASTAEVRFSEGNRRDLNSNPDSADEMAETLKQQYPESQLIRFVSDELVPCRQAARKQIQLNVGEKRISTGLPNPPPRNFSKFASTTGGEQEYALFQIVKYLTHSF